MTLSMRAYSESKQSKAGTRSSAFPSPLLQSQQARQNDADPPVPFITGVQGSSLLNSHLLAIASLQFVPVHPMSFLETQGWAPLKPGLILKEHAYNLTLHHMHHIMPQQACIVMYRLSSWLRLRKKAQQAHRHVTSWSLSMMAMDC